MNEFNKVTNIDTSKQSVEKTKENDVKKDFQITPDVIEECLSTCLD
ncbi:hypothetical protein [Clostridium sp.]|jgi:hypothetical protein